MFSPKNHQVVIPDELNHTPYKVEPTHLVKGKVLLKHSEVDDVKVAFKQSLKQADGSPVQRMTFYPKKAKLKKISILNFVDHEGNESFYAVYLGAKHAKHLGAGANGKVKLMQNIETQVWSAVKVFELPSDNKKLILAEIKREERNLTLLQRTPGGVLHETKSGINKYYLGMDLARGESIKKTYLNYGKIYFNPVLNKDAEVTNPDMKSIYFYKQKGSQQEFVCQYYDAENEQWTKKTIEHLEKSQYFLAILKKFNRSVDVLSSLCIDELQNKKLYDEVAHFVNIPLAPLNLPMLKTVVDVSLRMIHALQTVHDVGIIHRDVKPEQFIVDAESGEVVLVDLGSGIIQSESMYAYSSGITALYVPLDLIKHAQKSHDVIVQDKMRSEWLASNPGANSVDFDKYWLMNTAFMKYWQLEHNVLSSGMLDNDNQTKYEQDKKNYLQSDAMKSFSLKRKNMKNEALKELKQFKFTPAFDVYCLGLSIGQLFGLIETVHTRDHFGLDQPDYINPALSGGVFSQVYQVKTFDDAKQHNIFRMSENHLQELVDFLKEMTDADSSKRPTLARAKKFFVAFELKVKDSMLSLSSSEKSPSVENVADDSALKTRKLSQLLPSALFAQATMVTQEQRQQHHHCKMSRALKTS